MKYKTTIQVKAAFLLVIFSLNVLVGFGCSFGMCTCDANSECKENMPMAKMQMCHTPPSPTCKHTENRDRKGSCCDDNIIKFSKTDKAYPQIFTTGGNIFFTAFISSFYHIDVLNTFDSRASTRFFVRPHHPPIPDIRIAIQSFQI